MKAKILKRKPKYFKSKENVVSDNLLNRDFKTDRQGKKWVTDITYLIFGKYRLYSSVILDLFNNEIVAFKISDKNDIDLVIDTVKLAKRKRDTKNVILNSDRGFQYTSRRYNNLIKRNNMSFGMSRKGNCLDNACIESFFGHLKFELFHFKNFKNLKEVISAVKKYINFYNNERLRLKLNNLTLIEYSNQVE
ncbi:IS3 family transposase [Tepidibacter mesophilus]|uniref:IS3 family transposase n=1 Tax=Tepidibacter mesophilus TaxID=655607 RepID=UPI000C0881CE